MCARMPRDPGSWHRRTDAGVQDAALRLARQSARALRYGRPAGWLALALLTVQDAHPSAMARSDSGPIVRGILTSLAGSGDFRSGRRSRPGRQVSAGLSGCAERTVERWWRRLEALGLVRLTKDGRLLPADERQTDYVDPYPDPDATDARWRDASEFALTMPANAAELTDVQVWPYMIEATQLLGARARAAGVPVDNFAGRVLADDAVPTTVALSLALDLFSSVTVNRGSFSNCPRTIKKRRRPSPRRPDGRKAEELTGGATRHSPTGDVREAGGPRLTPEDTARALQLVESKIFPFLGRWTVPGVAKVLQGLPGWTVQDVAMYATRRLRLTRKTMMLTPGSPVDYLRWLLLYADPAEPPWTRLQYFHAVDLAQAAARSQARAEQRKARDVAAVTGRTSSGRAAALALGAALAAKAKAGKLADAAEYDRRAADLAAVATPEADWPTVRMPGSGLLEYR